MLAALLLYLRRRRLAGRTAEDAANRVVDQAARRWGGWWQTRLPQGFSVREHVPKHAASARARTTPTTRD